MNYFRKIELCVLLGASLLAGSVSAQSEQWLQYRTSREGRASRWLVVTTNAPAGVALPKFNAPPYFLRWTTPMDPAGGRWICLDRARRSGPYDRLIMDTDGTGRLDNKAAISAERVDEYYAYFPPLKITFKGEDGPITYHLVLRSYLNRNSPPELLLSSGGWYEGKVDLGGKKRLIQLIDGNVNGTFNDMAPNPYDSDRVRVDGDKVGERFLGRMLEVEGQFFHVEVARDGAFVKVQKLEDVAVAPVRVPENIAEIATFGENGHFVRKPEKGEFTLPTGKYRILSWRIDRKDDKGAAWTLEGRNFPEAAGIEVAAGNPLTLDVGEPVHALLDARDLTNREVAFNLRFEGRLGESIEILRGGQRPRGPQLTLTNSDGTFCYTNSFEFG